MQNKKQSLVEAVAGMAIGLFTSFIIQIILYPCMGIPISFSQNIIITLVFCVVSVIRGFLVRRMFNRIFNKVVDESN
mgnify:FL=1|tara:strand:+ start:2149 stop:2379 length:231 start_codon:yes stop_codon:yes gene_type:complete